MLATCLAGVGAPTAEVPRVLHVYFGDLAAPAPEKDGAASDVFVRAQEQAEMDFLTLVAPAPSASRSTMATRLSRANEFVALEAWSFGPAELGQPVVVLGDRPSTGTSPLPLGRFDLFYRFWLPDRAGAPAGGPLLHFPAPGRPRVDYGAPSLGSLEALREATAPYARTMQVAGTESSEVRSPAPHAAGGWSAYLGYLNAGFRLAPAAHPWESPATGRVSDYRTAILAPALTPAALLDGVRQRRVYASEDRNLRAFFSINGHPMGSVVAMTAGTPLRIEVTLSDPNEPDAAYWISLRRDAEGGAVDATSEHFGTDYHGDGRVVLSHLRRSCDATEYFLMEIRQASREGSDLLWTAPIWLVTPAGRDASDPCPAQASRARG